MVKITRETAERLLCLLAYVHAYAQHPEGDAVSKGYQVARDMVVDRGGKANRTLQHTASRGPDTKGMQPGDLFTELSAALNDYEEGASNIISKMVEILSSSNNMNSMVGENVRALRRAVLLPSEMAKVQEMLRKEMRCLHCGNPLINGQMVTATERGGDGMGFYCTNCQLPSVIACHGGDRCTDVGEVPANLTSGLLAKAKCSRHGGRPEKQQLVTEDDILDLQARAVRNNIPVGQPAPGRQGIRINRMLQQLEPDPLFGAAVAPARDGGWAAIDNGPVDNNGGDR